MVLRRVAGPLWSVLRTLLSPPGTGVDGVGVGGVPLEGSDRQTHRHRSPFSRFEDRVLRPAHPTPAGVWSCGPSLSVLR